MWYFVIAGGIIVFVIILVYLGKNRYKDKPSLIKRAGYFACHISDPQPRSPADDEEWENAPRTSSNGW